MLAKLASQRFALYLYGHRWAGVDSAWEQKISEARKMLAIGDIESLIPKRRCARCVGRCFCSCM